MWVAASRRDELPSELTSRGIAGNVEPGSDKARGLIQSIFHLHKWSDACSASQAHLEDTHPFVLVQTLRICSRILGRYSENRGTYDEDEWQEHRSRATNFVST